MTRFGEGWKSHQMYASEAQVCKKGRQRWEGRNGGGREDKGQSRTKFQRLSSMPRAVLYRHGNGALRKGPGVQNCHSEEQLLGTYSPRTPMDCHLEIQSTGTFSLIW